VVGTCTSIICIAANFSMTLRGESPGASACSRRARSGVQAIGQEGDEDMRFDPGLVLMEDRPDGEVAPAFAWHRLPCRAAVAIVSSPMSDFGATLPTAGAVVPTARSPSGGVALAPEHTISASRICASRL